MKTVIYTHADVETQNVTEGFGGIQQISLSNIEAWWLHSHFDR